MTKSAPSSPGWSSLAGLVADVVGPAPAKSRKCFDHALQVGSALPAELAEWLYFEDRGGPVDGPMDFIVGVGAAGRRVLAGRNPALSVSGPLTEGPTWAGIRDLARHWSTPSNPLSAVQRIWLEFDSATQARGGLDETSPPGVFVDLPWPAQAAANAVATLSAMECVAGRTFPKATRRDFLDLLLRLPRGVAVPYVGVFPSRGPDTVRVCLAGARPDQLPGLLPGMSPMSGLLELMSDLQQCWPGPPAAAATTIHVDLGPNVPPAVGLEYAFDRRAQRRGRIAEWQFLERLEGMGLLRRHTLDRCDRWPASRKVTLRHRLSPSAVLRRVAHVKLMWGAGAPARAKVYFAAWHTHLPWDATSIR